MTKLSLPGKKTEPPAIPSDATPETPVVAGVPFDVALRKDIVLALVPVVAKHSLLNTQAIVEIASNLCEYINTGRKQDTSPKPPDPVSGD